MLAAIIHLIVCMVVFSMVERLWPSPAPHKWWRRPLLLDICSWLILPLAVGAGITLAVLSTGAVLPRQYLWPWFVQVRDTVGSIPVVIQIAFAFIAMDFLAYWIHRAYHRFPFLWSFHVMHHSSECVDWLSTLRLHPLSQMINTALIAGSLLLVGVPLKAIVAANALIGFSAVLTHANVTWTFGALGRVFVSPLFHHWHHARPKEPSAEPAMNFGAALSIWDHIFGTATHSEAHPVRFGADNVGSQTLWSLLLQPLRFFRRGTQRKARESSSLDRQAISKSGA
jgi:sterol desaturase/sphingolipid hydroxylase (fatty acid hydroxylase superfamily)